MQEKVHFTPPEIKIFEGTTPPTSWFKENIVRYFQVKSEREFLNDLVTYAQELQSEKLSAARPKVLELKEEFVSLPDKATAEDVNTVMTFNTHQGYVKTEIQYLEKLVNLLKKADPSIAKQLEQELAQLKQIGKSFPKLSEEQLQYLSQLNARLNKMVDNVSLKDQSRYWEKQLEMLEILINSATHEIKNLKHQMEEIKTRNQARDEVNNILQHLLEILKAKPPSLRQLDELMSYIQTLANSYNKLGTKGQDGLLAFFKKLEGVKSMAGQNLFDLVANAALGKKVNQLLQENPNITPQQMVKELQKFVKESGLKESNLPFLKRMGESIEDVTSQKGFPFVEGFSGVAFAFDQNGKVKANEELFEAMLKRFEPDEKTVGGLGEAKNHLSSILIFEKERETQIHEGLGKSRVAQESTQNELGKSAAWAAGKSYGASSLPNQFKNAIINHYMPNQERYLRELAELLMFDNMGANIGNALMSIATDFSEASANYDFSGWLNPSKSGGFSGTKTQAQNRFNREKTQCKTELINLRKLLETIQSKLNAIRNDKNLKPWQRKQAEEKLIKIQKDAKKAQTQTNTLMHTLDQVTGFKSTGKDSYTIELKPGVNLSTWQTNLGTDETHVINGNPDNATKKPPEPVGGLQGLHSMIQTFQSYYGDQSQNQQMILQLRMTEIQQEWTVVSTALQLLNQMYMTVAQGIYK